MRGGGAAADVRGDGAGEGDRRRFRVGFPSVFSVSGFDEREEFLSETGSANAYGALRRRMESTRHLNSTSSYYPLKGFGEEDSMFFED